MSKPRGPYPNVRETMGAERVASAIDAMVTHLLRAYDWSKGDVALVGIQTRGAVIAHRIADAIRKRRAVDVPVGAVDITLYRDDLGTSGIQPVVGDTQIDFDLEAKHVVLIDDVLFTGRTIRAALDVLMDFGRPRGVSLVVLIDRGHREMPIAAEFAALTIDTKRSESVVLNLTEIDQKEEIVICEPDQR